jgi:hypothetical protein
MWILGIFTTLTFSLMTFKVHSPYLQWWQYGVLMLVLLALIVVAVILLFYRYFDSRMWLWVRGRKHQAREVMRRILRNPGRVPEEAAFVNSEVDKEFETRKPLLLGFSEC